MIMSMIIKQAQQMHQMSININQEDFTIVLGTLSKVKVFVDFNYTY